MQHNFRQGCGCEAWYVPGGMPDPQHRRRWAASYGLSLVLHACALIWFVFVSIDLRGEPETRNAPADVMLVRRESAADSPVPNPTAPAPIQTHVAVLRPVSPQPTVPKTPARIVGLQPAPNRVRAGGQTRLRPVPSPALARELARNVRGASPQATSPPATSPPIVFRAPATSPPIVFRAPAPAPVTTPTAVATAVPEPVRAPTAAPTQSSIIAPMATATEPPTVAPTQAPTTAPTQAPTAVPTIATTETPTFAPTATPAPVAAPMNLPTARPAPTRTAAPLERPSRAPVSAQASSTAGPAVTSPVARAAPLPGTANAPAARSGAAPAPTPPVDGIGRSNAPASGGSTESAPAPVTRAGALADLNDRLKHLSATGDIDYAPTRVKIGDAQSVLDAAVRAYEERLRPPLDILQRTFGLIYERRSGGHPDSVAYVYDTYAIGPITMCKAWKIIEHPYQVVREVGAASHSAGIGAAVATTANSANVRHDNGGAADIATVQFPCTPKSYVAVPRGSLVTPVPRHPDVALPVKPSPTTASPSPAPSETPHPAASASPLRASAMRPSRCVNQSRVSSAQAVMGKR